MENIATSGQTGIIASSQSPFVCEYDGWVIPVVHDDQDSISFAIGNQTTEGQSGGITQTFTATRMPSYPISVKKGMIVYISEIVNVSGHTPALNYQPFDLPA